MPKAQQRQGQVFEARVSRALNDLRREGKIRFAHKFVNCVGTPADFLVVGHNRTYLVECKNLMEGKAGNKGYSLRLSCLTDNEKAGMQAFEGPARESYVVWNMMMLDGKQYTYAAPYWIIASAIRSSIKHLRTDCTYFGAYPIKCVGENGAIWLDKLFD